MEGYEKSSCLISWIKKHEEFVLNQNNIIEKQKQMNMLGQWNTIIDSIMVQFLSTLLYILGANLVFDMKLSVGSVFAFITYSAYVTEWISAILNIGYLLSGIIPSTKKILCVYGIGRRNG